MRQVKWMNRVEVVVSGGVHNIEVGQDSPKPLPRPLSCRVVISSRPLIISSFPSVPNPRALLLLASRFVVAESQGRPITKNEEGKVKTLRLARRGTELLYIECSCPTKGYCRSFGHRRSTFKLQKSGREKTQEGGKVCCCCVD